jgi:hypothetical protein
MWQLWITFILGIILFIVGLAKFQGIWLFWLGGLLVALFSLWGVLAKK